MNWTDPAFEAVAQLLGTRTGLTFSEGRKAGAELGIRRAMARAGFSDPARYCERIANDKPLMDDLIIELTVGETYFFREPAQFQYIRRVILPEIRQRRGDQHILRAWSAGCASGEEAYSLAVLFEEEGLARRMHLLATDISRGALHKAHRATYGAWSLRGEEAEAARPYLHRSGDRFVVNEAIRRHVTFEYLNLALDVYPSYATGTWGMDLILCRNVLIYFDPETVRDVANRLHDSLSEWGWLLTASSDPPLAGEAPFETVVTEHGVFYRRGSTLARPTPSPLRDHALTVPRDALPAREEPSAAASPSRRLGAPAPRPPKLERANPAALPAPTPAPGAGDLGLSDDEAAAILEATRADLAQGNYAAAAERTRPYTHIDQLSAMHVRALANLDGHHAERACTEAIARHPFSSELHYLRAVLLLSLGRDREAARAARRVLYLDRNLAIAHFLLGSILRRGGNRAGAWRAYRNARDLCAARPADEVVPLAEGESAASLAEAARLQMAHLDNEPEKHR